jgi:hypothetical protein
MMNFEAVDATDNAWRFCLSTRLTVAYPKPVLLRSSWHRFVEQKGLAPVDRVVSWREMKLMTCSGGTRLELN